MFTQKQELTKDKDRYRKQFIRLVVAQNEDIDGLMEDMRNDVGNLVSRNVSGNTVNEDRISSGLKSVLALWSVNYLSSLIKFNSQVGKLVADQQVALIDNTYKDGALTNLMTRRVQNFEQDFTKRIVTRKFPLSKISVGTRIKTIEAGALKTAQDIIKVGIDSGKSAKQIAGDLDNWILPNENEKWVGPFDWFRERFGYKVKRVPVGRPAGSLYFNSMRIARTEINHTYREGVLLANRNQPWVKGYNWNLSPSHPAKDICDDWAGESPYKDYNEISMLGHPYCMCYITTDLVPINEL